MNGYEAIIVLVPEYELGVTILTAGGDADSDNTALFDAVQGYIIPVLEEMARKQAEERYAGHYVSIDAANQASLELIVDE
jgi:hypothetical protein